MPCTISARHVLEVFDQLGDQSCAVVLQGLLQRGLFHRVIEGAVSELREQIAERDQSIASLKVQNEYLRRRRVQRMTRSERKEEVLRLHESGLPAPEIAAAMTNDGEPMNAAAVRKTISRHRQAKSPTQV